MINAHIDKEKAAPIWAAVGAPLLGVPLMVALVALATPAQSADVSDPDASVRIEQVDVRPAEYDSGRAADCEALPLRRG